MKLNFHIEEKAAVDGPRRAVFDTHVTALLLSPPWEDVILVGIPGGPPYVIPCGSAGRKK